VSNTKKFLTYALVHKNQIKLQKIVGVCVLTIPVKYSI